MHSTPRSSRPVRRLALLVAACGFSVLGCREITDPESGAARWAHGLSFLAQFPGPLAHVTAGAGSVVAFNRVIVEFRRASRTDNTDVALRQVVDFGGNTDSLRLQLSVSLSQDAPPSGEMLSLYLFYLNAADDTVFTGGPVSVLAVPKNRGGDAPAPTPVPLVYTGPGASAVSVSVLPETLTVLPGAPFEFIAVASDARQAVVANAPVIFTSLDTMLAVLTGVGGGAGTARGGGGIARVRAQLITSAAADTAVLIVRPTGAAIRTPP